MAASLITLGFTRDIGIKPDKKAMMEIIDALTPEQTVTVQEQVENDTTILDGAEPEDVREVLREGLRTYLNILYGANYASVYAVPSRYGKYHEFYVAGGMTWGDDPFDGFTEVNIFLDTIGTTGIPTTMSGFVDWGIITG